MMRTAQMQLQPFWVNMALVGFFIELGNSWTLKIFSCEVAYLMNHNMDLKGFTGKVYLFHEEITAVSSD
jgi:hypothetical protein